MFVKFSIFGELIERKGVLFYSLLVLVLYKEDIVFHFIAISECFAWSVIEEGDDSYFLF